MKIDKNHIKLNELKKQLTQITAADDHSLAKQGEILDQLGHIYIELKNNVEGERCLLEALSIFAQLTTKDANYLSWQAEVLHKLGNLASHVANDSKKAIQYYEQGLTLTKERLRAQFSPNAILHRATVLSSYGGAILARNPGKAEEALDESIALFQQLKDQNEESMRLYGIALNNLGVIKKRSLDYISAKSIHRQALQIRRALVQKNPAGHLEDLGFTLANLGNVLRAERDVEAGPIMEEAVHIRRQLDSQFPERYKNQLSDALYNLALLYAETGQLQRAVSTMEEACEAVRLIKDQTPQILKNYNESVQFLNVLKLALTNER